MQKNHTEFLQYVFEYVKKYPDISARLTEQATLTLKSRLEEERTKFADIECLLMMSISNKLFKNQNAFFIQQIEKHKDKSGLKWDWIVEKLKGKMK